MKNKIKRLPMIVIISLLLLSSGCKDAFNLDTEPVNMLTEQMILSNANALEAHLAVIYAKMRFERFSVYLDMNTTQLVNCVSGQNNQVDAGSTFTDNPQEFNIWADCYSVIRDLNVIIKLWPDATAFTGAAKDNILGELKFLRAYAYFKLVRGYGGVPIVTEPMEIPSGDVTELHQPRAKEADVWKFVKDEMDAAIALLSGTGTEYRINKWSALAFKSRAMMYAGSVARYSQIQLDGVLGLPAAEAQVYFAAARDAAKQVIDNGPYALYNLHADKAYNYHRMIFDETSSNKERIFVTAYYWPLKTSPVDRNTAPYNHRSAQGYGSYVCVTLDAVETYEYVDNRNGALRIKDGSGNTIVYDRAIDLFAGKDPRFFAAVLGPGSPWKGTILQVYGNKIVNGAEVPGQGPDGIGQPEATSTGFMMAKWSDPNPPRPIAGNSSEVDKQCIRYAEVLLNYAEAQMELTNEPEARIYINHVRDRAGLPALDVVTMADIRRERYVELAFEDNCYWDWKRWRITHTELYARDTRGLWPMWDETNNKFLFKEWKLAANLFQRTYDPHRYYFSISNSILEANLQLVQNPGY
jgi:starch-binding outer membrane protein, SusD/RagB family